MSENDMEDVNPETTEVRQPFAAAAENIPAAGTGLPGGVRRRPTRRRRTWAALSAGSAAVVSAGMLLTASATGTQPALAAVTSAAKTAAQSYHISSVTSETFTPKYKSLHFVIIRAVSAFDPARHAGKETLIRHPDVPNVTAIRYIGRYVYLYFPVPQPGPLGTDGKHWLKAGLQPPGGPKEAYELPSEAISGLVNPQNLLAVLKSVSTVRHGGPASGRGWRGTKYSFSAPFTDAISGTIHGTVDVDREGRARQVVLAIVLTAQEASITGLKSITYHLTFSDFRAPVSVTAPPASQVYAPANTYFTYPPLYFVGPPKA